MKPNAITSLITADEPIIDGEQILFRLSVPDAEADSYRSQYFALDRQTEGKPAGDQAAGDQPAGDRQADEAHSLRRVTQGWHDSGMQIAGPYRGLLRSPGPGEPAQLFLGAHGAEPARLTDAKLGVSGFRIDPHGQRILFIARVPEPGRYGTDEDISADAEAPRHITQAAYLADELGYVHDRTAQLFSVPLREPGLSPAGLIGADQVPPAQQLSTHPTDVSDPQISPEGTVTVIAALEQPPADVDLRSHLWRVETDGLHRIDLGHLSVGWHSWLDAHRIVLTASELQDSVTDFVAALTGLFIHDTRSGETTRLTCAQTIDIEPIEPVVGPDCVWAVLVRDGAQTLTRIPLPGPSAPAGQPLRIDDVALLTGPELVVTGVAADGTGELIVTAATPSSYGEVFAVTDTGVRQLTAIAATLPEAPLTPILPQRLSAPSPLGEVTGWVAIPEGEGPFPVVLNIHGGPHSQYTAALFDETQVLLGAGIAVVYANPRGSNGRFRDWGRAVQGDMAEPAIADVLAVLDAALAAHPQLDASRQGVQGGSYGGYLTAMILNSTDRFRAGIVERGYLDPTSFIGTSDIGRFFSEEYTGTDAARIAAQSPLTGIAGNTTPTFVIHSERDFRCPLPQAQQYYAALQRQGTSTELLIFPGESHGLSRSGRPRHRIQRFEHMLAWWSSHLR